MISTTLIIILTSSTVISIVTCHVDRMHENLALDQPVEELDNLEKHARNLVRSRSIIFGRLNFKSQDLITNAQLPNLSLGA